MQEKLKQIFGKGKNFKLLPEEKQLIKSHLVLFARNNPLGKTNFLNLFFKPVFAASLITALLVGSVSANAEAEPTNNAVINDAANTGLKNKFKKFVFPRGLFLANKTKWLLISCFSSGKSLKFFPLPNICFNF